MFLPVENSHFGRPKTNFRRFQKWKEKGKKILSSFCNFSTFLFSIFHLPFYNFPSFLLNFHTFSLFSLPLFSRYVSKNFPVRSLGGGGALCPCLSPPPSLLHHCTVSGNFFPTSSCLHELSITCISSSFFRFFKWKKYTFFSSFFHSSRKKPISAGSFRTVIKGHVKVLACILWLN